MPEDLLQNTAAVECVVARRPCGLVLDIDGTISEIASRPEDARVSPRCRKSLAALHPLLDLVAVISGRPARQAQEMVGIEGLVYLGCHGLERLQGGELVVDPAAAPYQGRVQAAAGEVARRLAGEPGLEGLLVEDKGISITFHYRACHDPSRARDLILEGMDQLSGVEGLRVMEARCAVELLPSLGWDKGAALLALAEEFHLDGLLYLGDDSTDISAFRALRAWRARPPATPRDRRGIPGAPGEDGHDPPDWRGFTGAEEMAWRRDAAPDYQTKPHPAPPGRGGLAVAVASAESPPEVQMEADFILEGVPKVEEFLRLLFRLTAGTRVADC